MLDLFFMYVHRFEVYNGRAPTSLLDELDQTAWQLYGAYISPHDHWTNHVHVENSTYRWLYDTGWGNTFALFILLYGLHFYFKEKLQADPQMSANKRRRPPSQRRRASYQIRHSEPGSRRTSPNPRSKSESGFSVMYSLEPFPNVPL